MEPLFQLSLKLEDMDEAKESLKNINEASSVDWIKINHKILHKHGLDIVQDFKREFPEKQIVVDMNAIFSLENIQEAAKAGADIISIPDVAETSSLKNYVHEGKKKGAKVMANLDWPSPIFEKAKILDGMDVDYIMVNPTNDQEVKNKQFIDQMREINKAIKTPVGIGKDISFSSMFFIVSTGVELSVINKELKEATQTQKMTIGINKLKETKESNQKRMEEVNKKDIDEEEMDAFLDMAFIEDDLERVRNKFSKVLQKAEKNRGKAEKLDEKLEELEETREKCENLQEHIKELDKGHKEDKKELKEKQKKINEKREQEKHKLEKEKREIEKKLNQQCNQLQDQLEKTREERKRERQKLEEEKKKLKDQINALEEVHQMEKRKLHKEFTKLEDAYEKEKEKLNEEKQKLKEELENLEELREIELAKIKREKNRIDKESNLIKQEWERLRQAEKDWKERQREREKRLAQEQEKLRKEWEKQQEEIKKHQKFKKGEKEKINQQLEEIQREWDETKELKKKVEEDKKKVEEDKEAIQEEWNKIEEWMEELKGEKSKLDDIKEDIKLSDEEADKLKQNMDKKLTYMPKLVNRVNELYRKREREIRELRNQREKLEDNLQLMEQKLQKIEKLEKKEEQDKETLEKHRKEVKDTLGEVGDDLNKLKQQHELKIGEDAVEKLKEKEKGEETSDDPWAKLSQVRKINKEERGIAKKKKPEDNGRIKRIHQLMEQKQDETPKPEAIEEESKVFDKETIETPTKEKIEQEEPEPEEQERAVAIEKTVQKERRLEAEEGRIEEPYSEKKKKDKELINSLITLVHKTGEIELKEAAILLNVKKSMVNRWSSLLEEREIFEIEKPFLGETIIREGKDMDKVI